MKKDAFVPNAEKKKKFISMLLRYFEEASSQIKRAKGDAYVLIVNLQQTARLHSSGKKQT